MIHRIESDVDHNESCNWGIYQMVWFMFFTVAQFDHSLIHLVIFYVMHIFYCRKHTRDKTCIFDLQWPIAKQILQIW